jgi:hypothetical protein
LWKGAQRASEPRVEFASDVSKSADGALKAIVDLIPTDVIGIYLALVGIFGQSWWLFWIGAALIPVLLTITHFEKKKKLEKKEDAPALGRLLLVIVFAFVAYVPWAATLPDTPFLACSEHATEIGAGAAIVLSGFLPRLARLLGISA